MREGSGGWRGEVKARIDELIQGGGGGRPAVFDFDNTCILGDIGELYSHYLIDEMKYRYDLEEFWEQIDPRDGRDELRKITEAALALHEEERRGRKEYEEYLAEMGALYGRRLSRAGKRDCYEWAVRLHAGLSEEEMRRYSREAIRREIANQVQVERRLASFGEVRIGRGIRLLKEIGELFRALEAAEFEVWIVSATNNWTVEVFGAYFGIPAERVIGNRVILEGDRLTGETARPVLFREGKVEVIEERIGRKPALVAGDAVTDFEMLCFAEDLAVVIDRGDELLRREGKARGWAFQPQRELTGLRAFPEEWSERERR